MWIYWLLQHVLQLIFLLWISLTSPSKGKTTFYGSTKNFAHSVWVFTINWRGGKFQPHPERQPAFCHFWDLGTIGKKISSTISWVAKNIPKINLSQINLGLKIVSHLIHECPGKINYAFKQSWDKSLTRHWLVRFKFAAFSPLLFGEDG